MKKNKETHALAQRFKSTAEKVSVQRHRSRVAEYKTRKVEKKQCMNLDIDDVFAADTQE